MLWFSNMQLFIYCRHSSETLNQTNYVNFAQIDMSRNSWYSKSHFSFIWSYCQIVKLSQMDPVYYAQQTIVIHPLLQNGRKTLLNMFNPCEPEFTIVISSTTSRELLPQFSTCSGWRWCEVGENCHVLVNQLHENFILKPLVVGKLNLFSGM